MTPPFNQASPSKKTAWMPAALIAALFAIFCQSGWAASAEIVATGLRFPEGTIFVGNDLYLVDYAASSVFRLDRDSSRAREIWHRDGCGANGLVEANGSLWVACYDEDSVTQIDLRGKTLASINLDSAGQGFANPNDLARDAKGGIYFTASWEGVKKAGKVYYMPPGGRPRRVAADIDYANGVAVSADGHRLYVGESNEDRILAYDIQDDGSLANRQVFLALKTVLSGDPGDRRTPDGIRVDKRGRLFVSLYRGGGCAIFDANGKLIAELALPGEHHTNLSISPDGKFIYGTISYDAPQPGRSSGLYRIANPVAGK